MEVLIKRPGIVGTRPTFYNTDTIGVSNTCIGGQFIGHRAGLASTGQTLRPAPYSYRKHRGMLVDNTNARLMKEHRQIRMNAALVMTVVLILGVWMWF